MTLIEAILPIIILTGTALVVLVVEAFLKDETSRWIPLFLTLAGLGGAVDCLTSKIMNLKEPLEFLGGSLRLDTVGLGFSIVIVLGAFLVTFISHSNIRAFHKPMGEYYSLILFATLGMVTLALSNDMMSFFISLEVMSIAVYVLAGIQRQSVKSNESAIKYLVLGAFSTGFLLLGIAFVYGATGEMGFPAITESLQKLGSVDKSMHQLSLLGLGLILVGFLFKIGAFPFQQWVPDVYEGAPAPVTAYMATVVKAAAFAILARGILTFFKGYETETLIAILSVVAVLTMISGNFMALVQTNIKRLLAYSGIAHTGYLLLALVAALADPDKQLSLTPVIFYLLVYTLMTVGAFAVLIGVSRIGAGAETLEDIRGLGYRNKLLGASLAVFFFSMAGIPSTAGFMGKFFIFKEAIANAAAKNAEYSSYLYAVAIIGILTAVVSVYYYLRVVVYLYLKEENRDYISFRANWSHTVITFILLVMTFVLGFYPQLGFSWLKL